MLLPDYWLQRPGADLDDITKKRFDQLLDQTTAKGANTLIDYELSAPKWQFLCYAVEQCNLALHGSGNDNIELFEPRQSNDLNEFGNQRAVYAAADGIWPMYFAIVDRDKYNMSLTNACVLISGQPPLYIFSISKAALPHKPWRKGTVYLLPRDTFVLQSPIQFGEVEIHIPQLASFTPVAPLARLEVAPDDFPFLAQIRGHDDSRLAEYATALQTGAPWPD
jgi:hypothetical protein